MAWQGIVGKQLTPDEFDAYVSSLKLGSWTPVGVTIHHTAAPSLAQRPNGITPQHLLNLQSYYRDDKEWSAGPHLFIDRDKISVFTPLTVRGVHAVSFNSTHWGIEMLGDYDNEAVDVKVLQNTYRATSALLKKLGRTSASIKFHRECPHAQKIKKTCPGNKIDKSWFIAGLDAVMNTPQPLTEVTVLLNGSPVDFDAHIKQGANMVVASLAKIATAVPGMCVTGADMEVSVASFFRERGYSVSWDNTTKTLSLSNNLK